MRFLGMIVGILALSIAGTAKHARADGCDRMIVSGDPEYKPFSWSEGGTLRGAAVEIATRALDHIGQKYEVRDMGPFNRVLAAAEAGRVDLLVELKRLPEREAYLSFATTPIFTNPASVFTLAGRRLDTREWSSLIGLRGAIVLANRFGGGFDDFLEKELSIEEVPRVELGFAMLQAKRVDYFITSYYPGISYLREAKQEGVFEVQAQELVATDNFSALTKVSACVSRMTAYDKALAAMMRSGEMQRIRQRAIDEWHSRS